jgi:hypothetical protein
MPAHSSILSPSPTIDWQRLLKHPVLLLQVPQVIDIDFPALESVIRRKQIKMTLCIIYFILFLLVYLMYLVYVNS